MKFKIIPGLLMLIVLVLVNCKSKSSRSEKGGKESAGNEPLKVEAFVVSYGTAGERIEIPGTLLPSEETEIRSEITGTVIQLNFAEGKFVKKGTLLVKLFDEDLKSDLRKLEVQLKQSEKNEARARELVKVEGISQQEYDITTLGLETLKADIERIKIGIKKTEIRAPYDGTIGLRNVSLGAYISPGDVITKLRQVDKLKLEFAIPEKYCGKVKPGHKISFRVDGGEKKFRATVLATENGVDAVTRTLKVKAIVKDEVESLVPGSFAIVNLQLEQDQQALLVPTNAVIPQARNKQLILYKGDSAHFAVVKTGVRDSSYIQIVEGVNIGDTIITTGLMAIRPKTKINLSKVYSLTTIR